MKNNFFQCDDPEFSKLYIFGAGGCGREVAWLAQQTFGSQVAVDFLVDDPKYLTTLVNGIPVRLISEVVPDASSRFVVALGDARTRRRMVALFRSLNFLATSIVHPRAELSRWVNLGEGSVICAGVIATSNIVIGQHVHANVGCTISHDVIIGDYTTLSPGVHISGHVQIGQDVFIGTGANIINGSVTEPLIIADGSIVAAGACVIESVAVKALVAGVPAVRKR